MARTKLALTAALMMLAAACGQKATSSGALPDDMTLGDSKAKVTVVEYASVGCPVCGRWANEVFPAFKTKYVDTGKVHFVYKEMLVGGGVEVTVAASGFLLARCAGKDKYFPVIESIYRNQEQAFQQPRETLLDIARSVGMNDDQFNKCISDEAAVKALNERVDQHAKKDGINSTPTFVINGKQMEPGYHSLEEMDAAITAAGG
ncbi:MAG: thioredoxin domain-containing protein [Phenylobacterium sp.]|uniref:DsbA family protein n=1 Tax=Phenylobacterium sp. TaxID=1871053 RepID=UPI0025D67097|nr:DsbA family protein [Phenylobacterium sp.]MBI1197074.1 thioredoxin domain-containing protein [Phenylobacterium sp.]